MTDEAILNSLLSEGTSASWEKFLRRFSNLILKIIWQFERDHDEVMDKYLYVCEKLVGNNFAILRRFQQHHGERPPQFTTWLAAVTHNLCIDAHRAVHGRRQLPRAILRLPEFDREVFRLYYWRGYSQQEIEQRTSNIPGSTATAVGEALEKIQSAGFPGSPHVEPTLVPFDEREIRVGPGEEENDFAEMLVWLDGWLDALSDQERMMVQLWFWEDMSARDIAATMGISPETRVYDLLRKTMARLRERAVQTYAVQRLPNPSV
jgi:DNA-directed RNA polymerase specialized sigma24 family protein